MKNIDKIRMMTPEELTEWLMTDWEILKRSSTQTHTGMLNWFNKPAKICPKCDKFISTYGIIKLGDNRSLCLEICPRCYRVDHIEVEVVVEDDKT